MEIQVGPVDELNPSRGGQWNASSAEFLNNDDRIALQIEHGCIWRSAVQ
jgi:hypothetical protein